MKKDIRFLVTNSWYQSPYKGFNRLSNRQQASLIGLCINPPIRGSIGSLVSTVALRKRINPPIRGSIAEVGRHRLKEKEGDIVSIPL